MAFAQGSRSGLSYMVETTYGKVPSTPVMVDLPINTHSLGLTKQSVESGEIRSDRNVSVFRHGNKQIGGNIDVEFRAADYDDLLESAFWGQISTGVLKNGVTRQSLTFEDRQLDIGEYRVFSGAVVNTMSMSIKPNAMVTTNFGLVGSNVNTIYSLPYDAQSGNFTVGSTLTGGTSGATATILADTDGGTTGTLKLMNVVGTFVDNETITDASTGSAAANIPAGASVITTTSIDATTTAASGNDPFDSFRATLKEGGSTIATVTGLDFQIDNGVNPTFVIGSAVTPQLEYGRCKVSGTITAYFESQSLINKFVNETESSLECDLTDGTHTYAFKFPRIKYSGADLPLQNEQSRTITMPFMALRDAGEAATIKLTIS